MSAVRRAVALALPWVWLAPGAAAQHRPTPAIVVGAVLGSAGGILGGAAAGRWVSKSFNVDRGGEDPGLASEVVGGLAGSLLGTAVGAHLGGQSRRPPSFGQRVRDAAAGTVLGLIVGFGVSRIVDEGEPVLVAFSLSQGLYGGISNGRW